MWFEGYMHTGDTASKEIMVCFKDVFCCFRLDSLFCKHDEVKKLCWMCCTFIIQLF